MRRLLFSYSENFALALLLWPIASLLLTLPILAFLYHRDGRLHFASAVGCYIAVFYVMGLGCFTLYPLPTGSSGAGITYGIKPQLDFWRFLTDIRSGGKSALFQLGANVALFVPLGFIVARGFGWGPVRSALAGFAVSLLVETTQLTGVWGIYDYAYRTFDVDDLLTNTTGAFVGWAIAAIFSCFAPRRIDPAALEPTHRPGMLRRGVALAFDTALTWVVAIILVVVAQYALRHNLVGTGRLASGIEVFSRWSLRASIAIFELGVPLLFGGKTFGSSFVRMSCETKERRGVLRLGFFALRFGVILLAAHYPGYVLPALAVFGFVFKQMPYDLLPASKR